jgi:hypothetical protein
MRGLDEESSICDAMVTGNDAGHSPAACRVVQGLYHEGVSMRTEREESDLDGNCLDGWWCQTCRDLTGLTLRFDAQSS